MAEARGEFEHGYTCQEIVELATEYLEGAMTPEQMTGFELHLNFCDGCFSFVDQIRTIAAMARALSEQQIPDETMTGLVAVFRNWKRE